MEEKLEFRIPEKVELYASEVKVGTMVKTDQNPRGYQEVWTLLTDQRLDITLLGEAIRQYFRRINKKVATIIHDPSNNDFSVYIEGSFDTATTVGN